jgi:hypothetical protein
MAQLSDRMRRSTDELRSRIGEGARLITELHQATHARPERPPDDVVEKFRIAVEGADLAEEESSHLARDTQFELYVWGLFNAGNVPCRFGEPDLVCGIGQEEIGIAAKRIWSTEQAKKRLSSAAEQIERSGRRGLVAVNAQEYLSAAATLGELDEKGTAFNADIVRLHGHLPYLARKPHVLGLIVCGTTYSWPTLADGGREVKFTLYTQLMLFPNDDAEETFLRRFFSDHGDALRVWMQYNT